MSRRESLQARFVRVVAAEPGRWTRSSLCVEFYGSYSAATRAKLLNVVWHVRRKHPVSERGGAYSMRRDPPPAPALVKPYRRLHSRGGGPRPYSPPAGEFTPRQMRALAVMHDLHEVGGATAWDVATALFDEPKTTDVNNVRCSLIPYIVAKGAVIERVGDKYRIVELP